jgi:hypothetical protein
VNLQAGACCCDLRCSPLITQVCAFAQNVPAAANGHEGEKEDLNQQAAALLAKMHGMLVPDKTLRFHVGVVVVVVVHNSIVAACLAAPNF